MTLLKSVLSFFIYPTLVLGGGAIIILGLGAGLQSIQVVLPVMVVSALCVGCLERLLPYEPDWNHSHHDTLTDVLHYLVNFGIKQVSLMLYAVLVDRLLFADWWPVEWPLALQVGVCLAIIDLFLYLVHRWSHSNEILWRFHAVHHSSKRLYWVNGEKRHPLHQVLEGVPGVTLVLVLGAPYPVVVGALAILGINMMLQHGNIDYRAGWLRFVFCVAELHRWHHQKEADRSNVNFGAFFAVWDLLFKTYRSHSGHLTTRDVGIEGEPDFPTAYSAQLRWPLKGWTSLSASRK
ncbi:MAG: sterol desaturase family protein [Acidobacteria bacterium]|nr:sterol desaturase family protein [Acidobacteriota bacterium]